MLVLGSSAPAAPPERLRRCPKCSDRFPASFRVCPRDAIELVEAEETGGDPNLGLVLGDQYKLDARIAEGGMARVYEARHVRLPGRVFAAKILLSALARDGEIVGRFRREAEIASTIDHPNVVQVHDVGVTQHGAPYMISERLQGTDLAQRLERDGRLGVELTAQILRQLCAALAVLHERGVVHRDIKPDNLFLVGDPERPTVKLIDFGIAKLQDPRASHTRTGAIMGTPAYMAPEQARGEVVDARADIYGAGAIAYRCVTGRSPFDVDDPGATLHAVLTREPQRPRALVPDLPEAFEIVIQRAMARSREERFATPAALDEALAPFVGASAAARPSGDPLELVTTAARVARPTIALVSAVGGILLASGLADVLTILFADVAAEQISGRIVVVGTLTALATPAWLYVRFLREQVWNSSPRALAFAQRLLVCVGPGVAVYGGLLALERLVDLLFGDGVGPSAAVRATIGVLSLAFVLAAVVWTRRGVLRPVRA